MFFRMFLFPLILVAGPLYGIAQELRPSVTLGIETSRSWGVVQEGIGVAPLSLRVLVPIAEELFFSAAIGYDKYVDDSFESFDFTNSWVNGNETFTVNQGERGVFSEEAFAFAPGLRFVVPGGPPLLRMLVGFNGLMAWYPRQVIVRDAGVLLTAANGQTERLSQSRSVTSGMNGYGFGGEVSIALETTLFQRMILGFETGPSWFQRTYDTQQTTTVTGQRLVPGNPNPLSFQMEFERDGGLAAINSFDVRFHVYLGLSL